MTNTATDENSGATTAVPETETKAKAAKPPKKTAEEKAAEKKAAADKKAADKAAAESAKVAVVKDAKFGVTRPQAGVTKLVWDTADSLSQAKKDAVDRASLVKALEGKVEVGTIHTQYGRWRKYYGLTETKEQRQARLKIVRDQKDVEKAAKKLAKDQAKAAEAAKQAPLQETTEGEQQAAA